MTASADWLDWAMLRSSPRWVVTETTVATLAWMFAGNEPPMPAASACTLAAAASVAPYQRCRAAAAALGLAAGSTPAVSSRSSCSACTRPVTCCPSLASCDTRANWAALSAAAATRRPPKTTPMTSASTITASRRHDTGQSRKLSARRPRGWETGNSPACWLALPTRRLALPSPWLPTADVLAGYALACQPPYCDGTDATAHPPGPAASCSSACCGNDSAMPDEISGKRRCDALVVSCGRFRAAGFVRSAGPGRLGGEDRHRAGGVGRQHLLEVAPLPLEDEGGGGAVLAQGVEPHRTLDAGQRDAAVQVADDLRVVGAAGGGDRLRHHLADRVGLGYVGVDAGRVAAVLRDVLLDHLLARRVGVARVPRVGHHHPVRVAGADRGGERRALVRARRGDEHLRRVVLLLEHLHEGRDGRHVGGAEHHKLRARGRHLQRRRPVVLHLLREDVRVHRLDAELLQQRLGELNRRVGGRVLRHRVGGRLGPPARRQLGDPVHERHQRVG